ncbi:phosphatase PAP2 family protein, partial [candidate division GN15 bacterium]|nr:phosphatase PAP2 family protein [candidate division GN15 bacterium]
FRRRRPMAALAPELMPPGTTYRYAHQSFVSGHTSSSFFAMAFTNMHLRALMRAEMTTDEYRSWRWLPPTLLFGWASYVGWSRIHAYKHYITDVIAGALVGWMVAELFYHFGDATEQNGRLHAGSAASMLGITVTF